VPVKQGSGISKSGKVFGQGQKRAKMVRAGLSKSEISRRLNIGRTSVRRILTSEKG